MAEQLRVTAPTFLRTAALALAVLCCGPAAARTVTGVTLNWEPHYGESLEDGGALTAIVREAFLRGGHSAEFSFIPWNRALQNVEQGKNDFVLGAYYTEERTQTYFVSDPVYSVDLGLVAMKTLNVEQIGGLNDLRPYTIGIARGYANSEAFDAADFLTKETAGSPTLNLRKLFRGRIDMTIGAFDIMRHAAKQEKLDVRKLEFIQPALQSNALHLLGSRGVADGEQIIIDFNQGLVSMTEDGTLKKMLAKYLNRR